MQSGSPMCQSPQPTRSPVLAEYLAVPFILTFCVIVGLRCCFEIPLDLQANWIFKLWMDAKTFDARATAQRVLILLSLSWIAPITLVWSTYLWGFYFAMVHTLMVIGYSVVIVEVSLVHFRKLPFTCEYPRFESHSPLIVVAYLFAFILLTSCVPKGEQWLSTSPSRSDDDHLLSLPTPQTTRVPYPCLP